MEPVGGLGGGEWNVDPDRPAAGWTRAGPFRHHFGHPIGQDDRKRGLKGFDNHKKVKGRKRHIAVDTEGHLLTVVVQSASVQDYHGARPVLERLAQVVGDRLQVIWADSIYKGDRFLKDWVKNQFGWTLDVLERDPTAKGFLPLPKRWVVERTFAWLCRNRRLSKDYELKPETSETWIYIAMSILLVRRLAALS